MNLRRMGVKVLIFAAIVFGAYQFHRAGLLPTMIHWMEGLGPSAPAAFLLVYVLTAVFFMPSFLLTFAGGFLFHFWTAAGLSILGSGLGALSAFLIGRTLARGAVERWAARLPNFGKIAALAEKKGWKVVLLARFSPVFPFLIANYAFGATRMSARHYFFASVIGTIPSTLVYTYSGRLAGSLAGVSSGTHTPQDWVLLGIGLAASVAVGLYLRRLAQTELSL